MTYLSAIPLLKGLSLSKKNTEVGQDLAVGEVVWNSSNVSETSAGRGGFRGMPISASVSLRMSQKRMRPALSSETITVSSSLNEKSFPAFPVRILRDRSLRYLSV